MASANAQSARKVHSRNGHHQQMARTRANVSVRTVRSQRMGRTAASVPGTSARNARATCWRHGRVVSVSVRCPAAIHPPVVPGDVVLNVISQTVDLVRTATTAVCAPKALNVLPFVTAAACGQVCHFMWTGMSQVCHFIEVRPQCNLALVAMLTFCLIKRKLDSHV